MTMEKALTTGDGRLKENWIYISFWRTEQCVLWKKAPCFSLCNMNQVLLSYGLVFICQNHHYANVWKDKSRADASLDLFIFLTVAVSCGCFFFKYTCFWCAWAVWLWLCAHSCDSLVALNFFSSTSWTDQIIHLLVTNNFFCLCQSDHLTVWPPHTSRPKFHFHSSSHQFCLLSGH